METGLPDKLYYSIGEVARALNVNASLIRFWETEFEGLRPKKNKKGNRLFTKDDIAVLQKIYFLVKEKGHTLDGAKQVLSQEKSRHLEIDVVQRLEQIKAELFQLKNSFSEIIES